MAHIGIDALEMSFKEKVGMGTYTENLIDCLPCVDSQNKYTVYTRKNNLTECGSKQKLKNFHIKQLRSFPIRTFWSQCRMPAEMFFRAPQILHVLAGHKLPFFHPCKTVVTIHDLAFFEFKDYFEKPVLWRSKFFSKHAIINADKIIAISNFTKREVLKYYNVDSAKIVVIYHGVDRVFQPVKDNNQIKMIKFKYGIDADFLLFVGVLQPRKNLLSLLRVFKQLLNRRNDLKLVIVGNKGWLYQDIFDLVQKLGIIENVIFTGFIPKRDINLLMNAACLLIFPSLCEGFGLPVLEAMASGLAVAASNKSALSEIIGEAGIMFDPYDQREMYQAINGIMDNKHLREELVAKGLKHAENFSWEKTAKLTVRVYNELISGKK